ncbi:MAG TPA: hypothetical protein IAC95_01655 [Candidatus Fimimonas gallinarum]|uniref:Bacterial repeat domain-containing protein n=1 Tax=Candidatus Fimimonas gallinarum TaxID=2840821 RepID=A0A9D1E305_9BACT|nr:hypothetical protein [Candidatus Fimimonas gallinarum]
MTTSKCKILKAIALPLLAIIFVASVLLGVFADRIDFFANADSQTPTSTNPNAWDGVSSDTSFYTFSSNTLHIYTPNQLKGLQTLAGNGFTFEGLTVQLEADIDLGGHDWYPIENFAGIFDGNGHTVSNGVLNIVGSANVGFFGTVDKIVTIKNLTLKNFSSKVSKEQLNSKSVGLLLGENTANGTRIINCDVVDSALKFQTAGYPDSGKNGLLVGRSKAAILIDGCTIANSTLYEASSMGYRFGGILGGNTASEYDSVVRNCNMWNTYLLSYRNPESGTNYGLICGEGNAVTVENFHTNMINYTAGSFYNGKYDLSQVGLSQQVVSALDNYPLYDAYAKIYTSRLFGGSSYFTGNTSYDGILLEKSFLVDGVDKLADVYGGHGSLALTENVQNVKIEFDVDVDAVVTVGGVTVEDTNPDGKIVEFAVGDGFKESVVNIYTDGIFVARYALTSGDMSFGFLMGNVAIDDSPYLLKVEGNTLHITENAANFAIQFNAPAPEGYVYMANGQQADESNRITFAEIPTVPIEITLASSEKIYELGNYNILVWNEIIPGNDSVYYRNVIADPNDDLTYWTFENGQFRHEYSGNTVTQVDFFVTGAESVTFDYDISWTYGSVGADNPNTFQILVDGEPAEYHTVNQGANNNTVPWSNTFELTASGESHVVSVYMKLLSQNKQSVVTLNVSTPSSADTSTTVSTANRQTPAKLSAVTPENLPSNAEKYSDNVYYTVTSGTTAENTWTLSDKQFVGYIGAGNLSSQDKTILTLYFFGVDSVTIDYLYNFSSSATTLYGALSITDITDGANTPLLSGICGSTDTNQTFSKKYDTVGNYVWEIAIEASMHFPSVHPQTAWINQITAGIAGIDVNISYNSEYGNVTNIYAFSDTPLVNGTFELGTKIQPWAVAKDGYKYVGYRINGGDLITSNGDIIMLTENTEIEFVFQPEIVIPDEKLADFTFEFTQGDNVISEQAKFYTNYTVEAYPSDNSLLLTAPYLGIGETAKLYVNDEFVLTMQEESETFYGLMYNIADNAKIDIVYGKEGSSDVTFTFFIQFEQPMEGNLIADESLMITWENDSLYPYTYNLGLSSADRAAYSAGNSGVHDSASAIKFTVHGNGVLFFDYYISSEDDSVYGDFGVFAINNETLKLDQDDNFLYDNNLLPFTGMTGTTYVSLAGNNPYMGYLGAELLEGNYQNENAEGGRLDDKAAGDLGWISWQIPINTDVTRSDVNDIYIGYSRGSLDNSETYEDTFAIANVRFVSQQYTISAEVSNEQGGSVTSDPEIPADGLTYSGGNYTLTATVNDGYTFYGWADSVSGELVSINKTYVATVTSNVSYTAIIEPNGTYTARINGNIYETLDDALTAANEGVTGDLILYKDVTFDKDSTIPEGIHLIVPYSATDTTGYKEGGNKDRVSWNVGVDPYITVTVNSGVTLTVDGQLTLGGVQHHLSQTAQGHTSGDYSQIVNNGNIVLNGDMNVIGRVTGNGVLTVNSGATLKQPFLVNNYSGGTNTLNYYEDGHFPFVQFATVNIECKQIINYGAKVSGSTSLFVLSSITTQDVVLMDAIENKEPSGEGSLLWMQQGSRIEVTYDGTKCVNELHGTTNEVHLGDSGLTTLDIYGNVTLGEFSLSGYGSFDMILALPYTYNIVVKEGTLTVPADRAYKIMPGAKVTVESGATLDVLGRLYVYDGLIQADKSGKLYPNSTTLTNYGFSASGNLVVDGTLKVGAGATFAGIVQTTGTSGVIEIAEGAKLTDTIKEGSEYGYTNDKTMLTLSARVFGLTHNTLTTLEAGKTYKAYSGKQFVLKSFSVDSAAGMDHTSETINQKMQGIFLVDEGEGLYGVYGDVYIGENVAGVTVNISGREYTTDENGKIDNAYLVIDTDGKFDYYTVGKQTNTFKGVYGTKEAFVTLTQVIKGGELDKNNNYLREFDTNGITKDLDVKAYITYYGGGKSEFFALTGDIADGKLVAKVTFTNATYPVLDSTVTVKQTSTAIATYIEEVNALATAEGSQLVTKATEAYEAYTALRDGRQNEELEFLEKYLASYEEYFKVAKSLAIVGQVNYGDRTATANVTYIDGTTAETTVNNPAYKVQNGAVVATFQWAGNYQEVAYTLSAETQNVAKVTLTVSVDNKKSVYGDELEKLTAQVSGLVNGDTQENVLVLTKAGTNNAGTHDITASLKGDYQYFYNLVATKGTYTVTKRAITVVIEDKTSVYGDKLETLTATTTDDVANADGLGNIVTLEKAVGTNAGTYAITGKCVSDNYTVTFTNESGDAQNGTYTVTKRATDVTVAEHADVMISKTDNIVFTAIRQYDKATLSGATFRILKDGVLVATVAANGDVSVAEGQKLAAGEYTVVAEYSDNNFEMTFVENTFTVVEENKYYTVDFGFQTATKVYDGTALNLNVTVKVADTQENVETFTVTLKKNGETVYSVCDVGNYEILVDVDGVVYTASYTVTKREIDVTIEDKTSVYGDSLVALTATTADSVANAEGLENIVSLAKQDGTAAGTYAITGSYDNGNYDITFTNGTYTITKREVTVTVNSASSLYGNDIASLTATVTEGSVLAGDVTVYTLSTTATSASNVGSYDITGTCTNNNYAVTFENETGSYTVTARPITVVIDDKTSVYGENLVSLTMRYAEGSLRLVGGQTLTQVVTLTKAQGTDAGTYAIAGSYTDGNYYITFTNGTYTITQRAITVTVDGKTSVYGDEIATLTGKVTSGSVLAGDGTVYTLSTTASDVGRYDITGTCTNDNYSITFANTKGSYTVTKRAITVVIDDKTSVYGETLETLTATTTDSVANADGIATIVALTKDEGATVGTYAITGKCVSDNYTVTFTNESGDSQNGTYTVTKRDITVTVTDVETDNTVTFEALTQKFRWTVSQGNIVDGDDLNVEVYLVIGGTEITADNFRATFCGGTHTLTARFDNDNYNISLQNGTLSVTLPRVTVVDVQTQYVYSGSAIVPFHWKTNISGYLESADEYSFKATYYAADDVNRENPLQIVNAGDYVMVVSIVHTSAYQFADEAQTEFDIHVAKKDISDSISFVGIEDVLIVTNEVFVSATADDYDVAIDVTLKRGETEVESVSVAGDYTATAVVNDVNYTGSKQRSFTAIADAYAKLNDFVQKVDKLDGTFTQAQAQLIVELRGIAQGFTQDELLQIENTPAFKTAYEEYKQAWTQFVQQATEKVELAEKTYDGLLAVVATVTAMLLAAGVVIKKWLSC